MQIRWKITFTSGYALDDGHSFLWVSADDVRICRPQNFDRKWCSLKFRAAALRYKVGISVSSGEIVWVIGPFPAGQYKYQAILNRKMQHDLLNNEKFSLMEGNQGQKLCRDQLQMMNKTAIHNDYGHIMSK